MCWNRTQGFDVVKYSSRTVEDKYTFHTVADVHSAALRSHGRARNAEDLHSVSALVLVRTATTNLPVLSISYTLEYLDLFEDLQ